MNNEITPSADQNFIGEAHDRLEKVLDDSPIKEGVKAEILKRVERIVKKCDALGVGAHENDQKVFHDIASFLTVQTQVVEDLNVSSPSLREKEVFSAQILSLFSEEDFLRAGAWIVQKGDTIFGKIEMPLNLKPGVALQGNFQSNKLQRGQTEILTRPAQILLQLKDAGVVVGSDNIPRVPENLQQEQQLRIFQLTYEFVEILLQKAENKNNASLLQAKAELDRLTTDAQEKIASNISQGDITRFKSDISHNLEKTVVDPALRQKIIDWVNSLTAKDIAKAVLIGSAVFLTVAFAPEIMALGVTIVPILESAMVTVIMSRFGPAAMGMVNGFISNETGVFMPSSGRLNAIFHTLGVVVSELIPS
ncbi:hypothetical protein HYV57_00055 [Candidatus Peregrinibacteria bacterium]|nr:hypothetical protein [Candidatus Peregrinibacteria bacterium]